MTAQKNKRRSSGVCPLSDTRHDRVLGDKGIAVKVRGNSHYRNSRFDESSRNAYRSAMPVKVSRASGEVVHSGTAGIRHFHSTPRRVLLFYPFVMVTDLQERMKKDEKDDEICVRGGAAVGVLDGCDCLRSSA